jgi:hypothetical protein
MSRNIILVFVLMYHCHKLLDLKLTKIFSVTWRLALLFSKTSYSSQQKATISNKILHAVWLYE